jgi:hypothetical protein
VFGQAHHAVGVTATQCFGHKFKLYLLALVPVPCNANLSTSYSNDENGVRTKEDRPNRALSIWKTKEAALASF